METYKQLKPIIKSLERRVHCFLIRDCKGLPGNVDTTGHTSLSIFDTIAKTNKLLPPGSLPGFGPPIGHDLRVYTCR